jgi:hypothetical protein
VFLQKGGNRIHAYPIVDCGLEELVGPIMSIWRFRSIDLKQTMEYLKNKIV